MELYHRQQALAPVVAAFDGQAFQWGTHDCARLAAAVARAFGHRPGLARFGAYSTESGALRALKRAGFASLEDVLDEGLARIPPAMAWPGDIIGLDSGGTWPALTVSVGNGRVLGFMDGRCGVMQPRAYRLAWRVPCLR